MVPRATGPAGAIRQRRPPTAPQRTKAQHVLGPANANNARAAVHPAPHTTVCGPHHTDGASSYRTRWRDRRVGASRKAPPSSYVSPAGTPSTTTFVRTQPTWAEMQERRSREYETGCWAPWEGATPRRTRLPRASALLGAWTRGLFASRRQPQKPVNRSEPSPASAPPKAAWRMRPGIWGMSSASASKSNAPMER